MATISYSNMKGMMWMVYLVCLCNYEYEIVEGYFTDEAKAYEYCDSHNEENEYYNDLKYYVKVVKELK